MTNAFAPRATSQGHNRMPVDALKTRLDQRRPSTAGHQQHQQSTSPARRHSRVLSKKIEGQLLAAFRHAHPSTSEPNISNPTTNAPEVVAVAKEEEKEGGFREAPTFSDIDQNSQASSYQNTHLSRRRASQRDSASLLSSITTALTSSTARRPSTSPSSTRSPTATATPSISSTSSFLSSQALSSPDFDARSPTKYKKGPASHSSNGIETATGPPPALSTQRSYTNDPSRRIATSTGDFAFAQQQQLGQIGLGGIYNTRQSGVDSSNDSTAAPSHDEDHSSPDSGKRDSQDTAKLVRASPLRLNDDMTEQRFRGYGEDLLVDDRDRTLRALEGVHDEPPGDSTFNARRNRGSFHESAGEDQQQAGNEDLFLNLARADSTRQASDEVTSRSDRRRSRIALASHRQSLPPTAFSSPLTQSALQEANVNNQDESPLPNADSQEPRWSRRHSRRISQAISPTFSQRRTYAASAHPLDEPQRLRYPSDSSRLSFSAPRSALRDPSPEYIPTHERRPSLMTPSRHTSYRQSNLSYSAPHDGGALSSFDDRPQGTFESRISQQIPDGTESTASTTAPSTVWDELDDMKSRIRKLELTGKLPSSSGAAMTQATTERPRTATTTVTTVSSSPRRGRHDSISPSESMIGGPVKSGVHPLLQSAMVKSKAHVSPEVYRALEAATQDALSLASMANSQQGTQSQPGGSVSPSITDRQARRKADSMCRNLTDLCIALSDGRIEAEPMIQNIPSQSTIRPMSRDASSSYNNSFQSPSYRRTNSGDRDISSIPRASPSALSRLEARRSSLMATASSSNSPRASFSTPNASTPQQTRGLNRATTLIRRRGEAGENEEEREFRPVSRAATDAGYRTSPRERISREYTSQHPLPEQRSPSVQSNLPLRRHFASSSLSSAPPLPSTPTTFTNSGRRFLERNNDRDSSATGTPSEDRTERGSVLGQYDSGAPVRRGSLGGSGAGSAMRKLRTTQFTDSPPVPSIDEREYQ